MNYLKFRLLICLCSQGMRVLKYIINEDEEIEEEIDIDDDTYHAFEKKLLGG